MGLIFDCLAVGAGGALGAVCRYLLGLLPVSGVQANAGFPLVTFGINVAGAFLIGVIVSLFARNSGLPPHLLLFLKVGVCGGFTTFSTFSLEVLQLIEQGQWFAAAAYATLSVAVCVAATAFGLWLAR